MCLQAEQHLQQMRSAKERLEVEVAELQLSITTAHQDRAKAQAEVADLQRNIRLAGQAKADAQAEAANLQCSIIAAHQARDDAQADLQRYAAATSFCLGLAHTSHPVVTFSWPIFLRCQHRPELFVIQQAAAAIRCVFLHCVSIWCSTV